jgi:hypothetical protein
VPTILDIVKPKFSSRLRLFWYDIPCAVRCSEPYSGAIEHSSMNIHTTGAQATIVADVSVTRAHCFYFAVSPCSPLLALPTFRRVKRAPLPVNCLRLKHSSRTDTGRAVHSFFTRPNLAACTTVNPRRTPQWACRCRRSHPAWRSVQCAPRRAQHASPRPRPCATSTRIRCGAALAKRCCACSARPTCAGP